MCKSRVLVRSCVHPANLVEIVPEFTLRNPVLIADKPHKVGFQEVLPVLDVFMIEVEVVNIDGWLSRCLSWREGFGDYVVGEEVCIYRVENGWEKRCQDGLCGCNERSIVGRIKAQEGLEVGNPGPDVVEGLGCYELHFGVRHIEQEKQRLVKVHQGSSALQQCTG